MRHLLSILLLTLSFACFSQDIKPSPNDSIIRVTTTIERIQKVTPAVNPPNKPPVDNAGTTQTITLPINAVTLNGTASDPDGVIRSIVWSKSTTLASTIVSPNSLSTSVTGMAQGTHIFKLTATDDSGAVATSTVNIVVNPALPPPDTTHPAYMGFGALAVGGSQSALVKPVKTKADFDAAIGSNRTIKFMNDLKFIGRYDLQNISYLTIDGNGFDVTIDNATNGDGVSFAGQNTHHCIMDGIRVINAGNDNINILDGAHDILITNCSAYDSHDGGIDIAGNARNVTIQYCFIGRGAADWSGGSLCTSQFVSYHHNFFATATPKGVGERGPLIGSSYGLIASPNADIRNNIDWNWGRSNGTGSGFGIDVAYGYQANAVNNYGYTANAGAIFDNGVTTSAYGEPSGVLYASGNVSGNGVNANAESNHAEFIIPPQYQIKDQTACDGAKEVQRKVGPPKKNTYELGLINNTLPGCN